MSDARSIQHGPYTIQSTPGTPFPHELHPILFVSSNILCWVFWGFYLALEGFFIYNLGVSSITVKTCFWIGWVAECFLSFTDFNWAVDVTIPFFRQRKVKLRPYYELLNEAAPHVDIFVTCCGEPVDIVINTVKAAAAQDYPTSRFNVVVLDDGHDDNLEHAIKQLSLTDDGLARVFYRSRRVEQGQGSFFKAGNLSFGIEETARLSGGEFIASVDADVIASFDWLRSLLPHLILDSRMGLVTCPPNYYNVPRHDPLAQQAEFDQWNTLSEPIHDSMGEAMCMGTGFIVRRHALDTIGGWPLVEAGEDVTCSNLLRNKGWKIACARENLQHGLTPSSFQAFVKQRMRWVDAAFDLHSNNKWYLTNDFGDGISLIDKASGLLFALRDLASVTTLLSSILLPAVLMLTILTPTTVQASPNQHTTLRVALILAFVGGKVNDWIVYRHMGLTHLSNFQSIELWCSPYIVSRCIEAIFPTKAAGFFVTGTFISPINERSRTRRAPLLKRLLAFGLPMHITYVTTCSAILLCCMSLPNPPTSIPNPKSIGVVLFPGHVLKLAVCVWKISVPVWYMIDPPHVPGWRELVHADSRGVLRPKRPAPRYTTPAGGGAPAGNARLWRDAFEILVLCMCL